MYYQIDQFTPEPILFCIPFAIFDQTWIGPILLVLYLSQKLCSNIWQKQILWGQGLLGMQWWQCSKEISLTEVFANSESRLLALSSHSVRLSVFTIVISYLSSTSCSFRPYKLNTFSKLFSKFTRSTRITGFARITRLIRITRITVYYVLFPEVGDILWQL